MAPYVNTSSATICSARYIYYNKNDYNTLVIQYGNPKAGDAAAIVYDHEVIIEIKDMPALLLDKDVTYDEDGKIITPPDVKSEHPEYEKFINTFNSRTTIMDCFGSNYKLINADTDKDEIKNLLNKHFDTSDIDLIITSTPKDELIAIKPSDICFIFEDGEPLIKTDGSEIRPVGKNNLASPFTPQYLEQVLIEKDIKFDEDTGLCRVYNSNDKVLGGVHGRGCTHNDSTRFKISHAFFVKTKDVTMCDNYIEFPKKKIRQCKSGISIHIEINKTKNEIKDALY